MSTTKRDQLWESLGDPEFRKQLINDHIDVGIAFQIKGLRDRQNLTQKKLGELLGGNKQPQISAWENPNYGKYTLETLKDLAKAFDVGLLVRFVPFSKLIDWTVDVTSDVIAPPSFRQEQVQLTTKMVLSMSSEKCSASADANNLNDVAATIDDINAHLHASNSGMPA